MAREEQSWADDLESLGYVLLYCARGSLPWQGFQADNETQKNEMIRQKKISLSAAELCEGLPSEFVQYIDYVRSLKYEEKPDYAYLRRLFSRLFSARGFKHDHVYDWTEKLFYEMHESEAKDEPSEHSPKKPKAASLRKRAGRAREGGLRGRGRDRRGSKREKQLVK